MKNFFLKFSNQSEALSILQMFVYKDEQNNQYLNQNGNQWALHEVGEIPGTEGWHINLRIIDETLDVSALESYRVYPKSPVCVWA